MLFNLWFWILLFGACPVYWQLPHRTRPGFLAAVSFGFVFTLAPESALALGGWTLLFYFVSPLLGPGRRRRVTLLWGLVLAVLGVLCAFKYVPALLASVDATPAEALVIPLGISYYSFKLIHYAVEVGRGGLPAHSFQDFASYMFLFPIFPAGPIERFDHYNANQAQRWDRGEMLEGLNRLMRGVIKKFLFAQVLFVKLFEGRYTPESIWKHLDDVSTLFMWVYLGVFYLWVYLDFSAYSDIAIGGARLFGIRIAENFNFPIVATHIRDYWRRWHISLSQWCQFYVYMPLLGLYRKPLISLYGTFLVMGLWHEGTLARIGWGMYHATGVAVYSWWSRYRKRRKWKFMDSRPGQLLALVATQLFIAGSMSFLMIDRSYGLYGALRVLGRLVFLHLPT